MMLGKLSRRCYCTSVHQQPWLFLGLGNPGDKYNGTRHNIGFEMIDVFAESVGIQMNLLNFKAIMGQGFVGDLPVILAKPQTYMNLSGESSGPLAAYYKLPLNRVLVVHDDTQLPCGVLRLQEKGGHGCHNGLKSVMHHFRGNKEFARLRIGIGKPPGQMDPKAFLLQKFSMLARERIDGALAEGVEALKLVLSKDFGESWRLFNLYDDGMSESNLFMLILCGCCPLLECCYSLGCARWDYKRYLYTAGQDSQDCRRVSAFCRYILSIYEDDIQIPLWEPPQGYGYGINKQSHIKQSYNKLREMKFDGGRVCAQRTVEDEECKVLKELVVKYPSFTCWTFSRVWYSYNVGFMFLCIRCMKDTCVPEQKLLKDPRRLYTLGRKYHIVERKPYMYIITHKSKNTHGTLLSQVQSTPHKCCIFFSRFHRLYMFHPPVILRFPLASGLLYLSS
uniref:Peptidyl-tRNA hydrolase n=1 Tax=Brassica campestris TaxID=3711 RepID=M4EMB2_BRACM